MCARRRVDGIHGQPRSPIQLIPTPAQYSGLPKRTSRGTNSASAAEKAIRVRVGRLRGAVKAAADAAIATIATECLSILKRMSRALALLQQHDSYTTVLAVSSTALRAHRAGSERPIAGFGARPIETKRVQEDECVKSVCWGHARPSETPAWSSTQLLADCC